MVTEKDVKFDYKLKKGVATTRNAIKLLGVMNFHSEITEEANGFYQFFIKNKRWPEEESLI